MVLTTDKGHLYTHSPSASATATEEPLVARLEFFRAEPTRRRAARPTAAVVEHAARVVCSWGGGSYGKPARSDTMNR